MPQEPAEIIFDEAHAERYDRQFQKVGAMKDALHLVTRLALQAVPSDARVLCVGAGTGQEILYLAEIFPGFRFMAVEPAPAMLAKCRQACMDAGIGDRCAFHAGYLDSLPIEEPYDVGLSLLVSHFIVNRSERLAYFEAIATRLKSGATLINADISGDQTIPTFGPLKAAWLQMQRLAGTQVEDLEKNFEMLKTKVGIVAPSEVAALIQSAGFSAPTQIYQSILIHGWTAQRL